MRSDDTAREPAIHPLIEPLTQTMTSGNKLDNPYRDIEVASIKLAAKGRLVVIALFTLYGFAVFTGGLRYNTLVYGLAFGLLAVALFYVAGSRYDRPWIIYLLVIIEVVLLADAVLTPNPFNPSPWPDPMVYRYENFYYFLILIAVSVFTYRPAVVMWTGISTAIVWTAGLMWILSLDNSKALTDVSDNLTSAELLRAYTDPFVVVVSSRIKEILCALVIAGLLAIVVWRGRSTVLQLINTDREHRFIKDQFGRYVPSEVARAIIADRGALVPEERTATVLFVDIVGFTSAVENKPPAEALEMLNEYFTIATQVITDHHGVVTQFQGDAILATYNVPLSDPQHAQHAVDSADALERLCIERRFKGQRLELRIGINTGRVVAGSVGSGDRMIYTVHGDAVNVAARLEQLNKRYDTNLLISASTVDLLSDRSRWLKVGESSLRGREQAIGIYAARTSRSPLGSHGED